MKKVLVGAVLMMFASAAQASYLKWQVDSTDYLSYYDGPAVGANLYAMAGNDTRQAVKVGDAKIGDSAYSADLTDYANYNFYVEVVNYDSSTKTSTAVARSEAVSYESLSMNLTTTLSDIAKTQVWHASNYSAAPEPTSAMLMMMGVAFLGLKRRKA